MQIINFYQNNYNKNCYTSRVWRGCSLLVINELILIESTAVAQTR